ncbi:hypothetical protein CHELA1G11_12882 [Hyphomicrobiales bacterium]|nr:hypothetical protein CHELA1G2_11427 [Hyphomicrobiales bacterium]CAH1667780.1 hypothetical protein CHELA1G11_12882 [Hyphomicrobiales bacterium]
MARIRSIHPGFFTDERMVMTSMQARLMFLGLGVEADDKGIFEWKPLTLKMRIFPADNIDVSALLDELTEADVILSYEIEGRRYGAIRNFGKHQRPKTPNDVHPTTPAILHYVALPPKKGEMPAAEPAPFPQKGEKPPQMEDGGGKREKEEEEKTGGGCALPPRVAALDGEPPPASEARDDNPDQGSGGLDHGQMLDALMEAGGDALDTTSPALAHLGTVNGWLQGGADFRLDILPTVKARCARRKPACVRAWGLFTDDVQAAFARRRAASDRMGEPVPIAAAATFRRPGKVDRAKLFSGIDPAKLLEAGIHIEPVGGVQ